MTRVEQVVGDDFVIVVGSVRKGTAPVAVPDCPDSRHAGAQFVIHFDVAAGIDPHSRLREAEIAGVRHASHREEEMGARHFARAARALYPDHDLRAALFDRQLFDPGFERDAFVFKDGADRLRNIGIFPADDLRGLFDDRDLRAESPVDLRELEADVAAADDHQVLRQEVDLHDGGVREVVDAFQPGYRRHHRAAAHVDEDVSRFEDRAVHADRIRRREARVPFYDGQVGGAFHPFFDVLAGAHRDLVLARLDALHVHCDRSADHHAIVGGPPRQVRRVSACDERFGRHASGVDAGAAEEFSLDDRDFPARASQPRRKGRAGLSRANDDGVEMGVHRLVAGWGEFLVTI